MIHSKSAKTLGRYEIISELGQGAMGVVYKARDPMLDRVVAIKTINLTLPKDELAEFEARFYQEAKAAGGLSHRNIVTIHDIGRSDRVAYMAMEILVGQELRALMQSRDPIKTIHALDIGAQVAEGLQYAHDRQIIHRDIKPANIMVLNDGLVKITDFGIARMRNNDVKTMTGMILGSPKYMSPEQVAGKRVDARSDIFSLGVVIYEMLTGTPPFIADNIHGIMYQTMNFNPPAPTTLNSELPDVVNFIVAKALAKNVDDRYQKATDLSHDLRRALTEISGEAAAPLLAAETLREPVVELAAPKRRKEEKKARIADPADNNGAPQSEALAAPADTSSAQTQSANLTLGLSKAFYSFDATMRLAALTGMDEELKEFSKTQKIASLKTLADAKRTAAASASTFSASTTWERSTPSAKNTAPTRLSAAQLKFTWIGSALMVLAATILLLLR